MEETQFRDIRRLALGLALVAGAIASGAAQAATFTQTQTLNSNNNPTFTGFNGFNGPGTLTAVTLGWDLTLDLNLSAFDCADFGDCEPAVMDWDFSGEDGAFGTALIDQTSQAYGINNSTNDLQRAFIQMLLNGSSSFANLGDFLGAGVIGQVRNEWASQADYVDIDVQSLTGDITLTYTYDAVPVPATLALFGLGLAGIGLGRRRRRT